MKNRLSINGGAPLIKRKTPHFVWPIITRETEEAVLSQIKKTISIYDKSGVIAELEDTWSKYHDLKYSLSFNSGTSALYAMFESIQLRPGDEIICPTYTFFATISPIIFVGAKPIFCDCLPDGNIDPHEIEKKITKKTKAIIITHMWGLPCDMDRIVVIARKNHILLLEDCSHAHGAKYKNRLVGTFGDAAVWSLQGQKIITGGEGGILSTNNKSIYYNALLVGHYNKRCKQEIPKEYMYSKFSLTGFGLKLRIHPLSAAIALEQIKHFDKRAQQRKSYALLFIKVLRKFKFIKLPDLKNKKPSWYGFVFNLDHSKTKVTAEKFFDAIKAEGAGEIDLPRSTCPIESLPLFREANEIKPHLYKKTINQDKFVNAKSFYESALKLPVWTEKKDRNIVIQYAKVLDKVCKNIHSIS